MTRPDFQDIIGETRAAAGPLFVSARVEAEEEARQLLNDHVGRFTPELASRLGRTLNRHYWGTGVRHNRFLPGLSEPLLTQMVSDIEHFNQVVYDLWRAELGEAVAMADRVFTDRSYLPGSGRSFPSVLLYLRDNERFAIWFQSIDRGLSLVSEYEGHRRSEGLSAYEDYCSHVATLRETYGLEPQEIDAVLSGVVQRDTKERAEELEDQSTPSISTEAYSFLAELRENNSKEWFNANRQRYEEHVRDPVAEVLEAVAAQYIRGLDPKLNTDVQRDQVLARINKWAPDGPYYAHYWGAFSRAKKQEDTQLFFGISGSKCDYGLRLGSAPREMRERLADRAEEVGAQYLEALERHAPGILWEQGDGVYVSVKTPEDLAEWARGPDPRANRVLPPDHELIGSPISLTTLDG